MKKKNLLILVAIMMVSMVCLSLVSCSKDEEENFDTSKVILQSNTTKTIEGKITSMVSANEFVATTKENVITGSHVGSTVVKVNDKYEIPVEVIPRYYIIQDPVTEWGASFATVKAKQTQGQLIKETDDGLRYDNCGDAETIIYTFENGKLHLVGVLVPASKASVFVEYLKERFAFYPGQLSDYTFVGMNAYELEKANIVVALRVLNDNYVMCVYMPQSDFTRNSAPSKRMREIFGFEME